MAGRKRSQPSEVPSSAQDIEWIASLAKQQEVDIDVVSAVRPSYINDVVSLLRNQTNSIVIRAMAARTLGLLMEQNAGLQKHLQMDSDVLIDALLQIVNHCRYSKSKSIDHRKIHVNCCLVISMLMQTPHSSTINNVVNLRSELLILTDSSPTKLKKQKQLEHPRAKSPVSAGNQREDRKANKSPASTTPKQLPQASRTPVKPHSRHTPMRSILFGDEGDFLGLDAEGNDFSIYEYEPRYAGYGVPKAFYPFHRPNSTINDPYSARKTPSSRQNMRPRTFQRPSRALKGSKLTTALAVTPNFISPSKLYTESLPNDRRPFLLPPDHILEIMETNQMPISLPFSRQSIRRTASPQSRLQPKPWGDFNPVVLDTSFKQHQQLNGIYYPGKPQSKYEEYDEAQDMNSAEYKRRRLKDIIHCPIESTTTKTIEKLARDEHQTTMQTFSHSLVTLYKEESAIRANITKVIHRQKNLLPLKFLFELPGGVGYCRERLQKAMSLWVEQFEVNQQQVAWLQWKALVEQKRYNVRMGAFVRQAALKRMRLAMDLMVKAFIHKGFVKWVASTQTDIWFARDSAIRKIQPYIRRHFALKYCLALHDAKPVNGAFRDMYLEPPRLHLPFTIPLRIRLERRQLWKAAISVQAPFRGRRFRKFMKKQRNAAIKIQACVRRRIAMHAYQKNRKRILRIQTSTRRFLKRKQYLELRQATLMVQRNWRGRAARKFVRLVILAKRRHTEEVWQIACLVQRLVRGFLARRVAKGIRNYLSRRVHAALLIQKNWYRRNNEWTTFFLLGCLREKDAEERQEEQILHRLFRIQRARVLQRYFQAFIARQRYYHAIVIQSAFRCYQARKCLLLYYRQKVMHRRIKWWFRVHHNRRHRAATRIQYWWLKAVPRRMFRHLARIARGIREKEKLLEWECRDAAATKIQALIHGAWTRAFVKKTRAVISIQSIARGYLAKKFVKKLSLERRLRIASAWVPIVILKGVENIAQGILQKRHDTAIVLQRNWRGAICRLNLVKKWANDALRHRMAIRLQTIWRRNAQKRFAARILTIQRRRISNPYRELKSIIEIVNKAIDDSLVHYDPFDPMIGLGLTAWLRCLGLDDIYDDLVKLGCKSVQSLSKLTKSQLQSLLHTKDRVTTMTTAIHHHTWLAAAKNQRKIIAELETTYNRLEKPYSKVAADITHQKELLSAALERQESVEKETQEFKHPPRALRHRVDTINKQVSMNKELLVKLENERDRRAPALNAAKDALENAKRGIKEAEEHEVKAVFLQKSCHYIDSPEKIKRIFLDYFPGMEYRALSFIESLRGKDITACQLFSFFSQYSTISDVKLHTPKLVYSKHDAEITKSETNRRLACCDSLQYSVERIAEILSVSVVTMADPHASSPLPIEQAFLEGTHLAHVTKLPQRPMVWRQCLQRLLDMHKSANMMQRLWRTRQGRQLLKNLRVQHLRTHLKESYEAERNRQSVRSVWEADVKQMKLIKEKEGSDYAHQMLLYELGQTLRFGYEQDWNDEFQVWYYIYKVSGTMKWERPIYEVLEHNAALKLQRAARRYLERCRYFANRRANLRASKKEKERVVWEAQWMNRQRYLTLRITPIATSNPIVLKWISSKEPTTRRRSINFISPSPLLEAHFILFSSAYHKSVLREAKAHLLSPVYARLPNIHASALIEMLLQYHALSKQLVPDRSISETLKYTKVEMPFGWKTIEDNNQTYYYNSQYGNALWEKPEYVFDEEYAARTMQACFRMFQGRKAFLSMLYSFSFVEHVHATIAAGAAIGWVGFGLEGMPLSIYLCRLGLAKHTNSFTKGKWTIESFWAVPEAKWLSSYGVSWSKEDKALLKAAPRTKQRSRRYYPLSSTVESLPEKHGFQCIPNEKSLQSMLLAHFTGQQGRVLGLVRAVKELAIPLSTKQLDMYIRLYSGRPQQAIDNLVAEVIPANATTEAKEIQIYKLYQTSLSRCVVIAANMNLGHLARRLEDALTISNSIVGIASDSKLALKSIPLTKDQLAKVAFFLSNVKGMWEHNYTASRKLSIAQATLYLRHCGLEFCLQYIRSTILVQSFYRMARLRRWYLSVVAYRNRCALAIQLGWRCSIARSIRQHYLDQQRSEYEEHYVEKSQLFYYIYLPTQERLNRPPVDEYNHPIPYRPMVIDRLSKKYILSWPWLVSSNQAPEAASVAYESNIVCSICKNEKASRVCDVCCLSSGDYIYYCFACFCVAHPATLSWHTYQPLNRLQAQSLRCIECTRYSTQRCLDCKEDYCERCFMRIHTKGKRSHHLVESYPAQATVCIECEERVALRRCTICDDALCQDCISRTHSRGNKAKHTMEPLLQTLPQENIGYCVECAVRAAEKLCRYCHQNVCTICNATSHPAVCLESQLEQAKLALYGDNICVDCGKVADRQCVVCGDKY
ncbi:hypothetical protein THRCLA_11244, partial [Thraustotheca clavata]